MRIFRTVFVLLLLAVCLSQLAEAGGNNWSISSENSIVKESHGTIQFTLTRRNAASAETVYVSTDEGSGAANRQDFAAAYNKPVRFAAGVYFRQITIKINNDRLAETDETFGLVVRNSAGRLILSDAATFTIANDDGSSPNVRAVAAAPVTVTLTSALDTYLRQATATTSYGTATIVNVDGSDGGGAVHGLLYFNVIGSGANQVPAGSTINSATLTLRSTDGGNGGTFYRMLQTWNETSTWSSMTNGIQTNGTEARSTADFSTGATVIGTRSFDVSSSVAAWAAGEANFGWAIIPLGTNGWDISSRQGLTAPSLSVTYTPAGGPLQPTASLAANPTTVSAGAPTTLTWASTNATACTGTNFSTGGATSGSVSASPVVSTTYSVNCTGDGGSASASASVTVGPLQPTASLNANPTTISAGASTTLTWSSTNATACTGTNFSTGSAISGSVSASPAASTTYSVSCTGDGGSASASASVTVQTVGGSHSLDVRVAASADDAEESSAGAVNLTSTDLELVQDTTTQTVGMRFANILIPRGAAISNAYVQFQVDEVSTATPINLNIQGQAVGHASAFAAATNNVSSRARTTASVPWVPVAWPTIDVTGVDQRTSNIALIIHEIVNRSDWTSGNALALIITGSGKRVAEAYDGVVAAAPLLHVEWSTDSSDTTPPTVSITSPSPGTTLTGVVTITANASDDTAVQSVQFRLGGTNRCTAAPAAPYTCALDTRAEANGSATLTAVATDTSGNSATSDPITVTIDNPPPTETIIRVPEDYATPQAAINAAANGNVVLLGPGTYAGGITISGKTITLASYFHISHDPSYIPITTISGGTPGVNVATNSPNVIVEGLRFTGGGDGLVLRAPGGQSLNNRFESSGADALSFEIIGGIARGNTCISPGDDCIDADVPTTDLLIENNVLETTRDDGIEIRMEPLNGAPVPLPNLVTVTIRGNKITSTGSDGIQLIDQVGIQNRRFVIERNLIRNCRKVGLGLLDNGVTVEDYRAASMPERVHVFNNTFDGNNYGITGGDNLIAVNNIISRSTTLGMKNIDGSSIVARTLFWNNTQDQIGSNMDAATTISGNPLYTPAFELGVGSPAIDAGTATFTHSGETVLTIPPSGYAGSAPDLGRYESGM